LYGLKKIFFITFLLIYIIIAYFSAMAIGIKWDESATLFVRFYVRTKMALTDGLLIKVIISLACALAYTASVKMLSNKE
jgi:hypothetical protein